MFCEKYERGLCTSCRWLKTDYGVQLQQKEHSLTELIPSVKEKLTPSVQSAQTQFRNKAKMVVLGTVDFPLLGIINEQGEPVDLADCPLYPDRFQGHFEALKRFIKLARLTPYNMAKKRGELKFILLTEAQDSHQCMVRFVLRSETQLDRIKSNLLALQQAIPEFLVISVNIQPVHQAIIEGDKEILLTEQSALPIRLNDHTLFLRSGGFFQTNSNVASRLYLTAKAWTNDLLVPHVVELFCGSSGFGLHCLTSERQLSGYDISEESIRCARLAASGAGSTQFESMDLLLQLPKISSVDLLIVNPPRRGVGANVLTWINEVRPRYILYSSCNAQSLASDLMNISEYRILNAQIFDMFPHTAHFETLVLLARKEIAH